MGKSNPDEKVSGSTAVAGMAEAADIVGVSKSNFSAHRQKFNEEGQCPAPTAILSCGPVWAGKDVALLTKWAKEFSKVRVTRNRATKDETASPVKKAAKKVAPATAKKETPAKPSAPAAKAAPKKEATKPAAKKSGFLGGKSAA